jgi:HlyD family secretion protein
MEQLRPQRGGLVRDLSARGLTVQRLGVGALLLVVLVVAAMIGRDVFFPPQPSLAGLRTAAVTTGVVSSTVTGTGSLVASTQQGVNFRVSGVLTEVDVKVGDHVSSGQVLAKIDPSAQQLAVQQAQSQLQSAQAQLDSTLNGTAVVQAQNVLAQAQQAYNDTRSQNNLSEQQDQQNLSQAQQTYNSDGCLNSPQPARCSADQQAITSAQNKQQQDLLSDQQKLHQAQNAITNAQTALSNSSVNRQSTLTEQEAAVAQDQAGLQNAEQNLSYTTLTSPMNGTVVAVNGVVGGGSSGSGSGSSPAGSGGSSAGGGSGGSGTGSSGAGTGSSSGLVVISDQSAYQVVAPFAETDASRIQPNQQAQITFDALTSVSLAAHVVSVAPAATVVSNVTDYAVTLALDQRDARLKEGMTANAAVTVSSVSNVLRLANSAIQQAAGQAYVTLVSAGGTQTRIPIQTGLVGDTYTEIQSGLRAGDRILLPSLSRGTTPGSQGALRIPGAGGGPGGGGGGGPRGG